MHVWYCTHSVRLQIGLYLVFKTFPGHLPPGMLLLPWSVGVREPLTHLAIGERIDLTACVPLVKDV